MANSAHDMPAANRPRSEIDFVLRRAKWKRGPEVLRDLARVERTEAEPPPPSKGDRPRVRGGSRRR